MCFGQALPRLGNEDEREGCEEGWDACSRISTARGPSGWCSKHDAHDAMHDGEGTGSRWFVAMCGKSLKYYAYCYLAISIREYPAQSGKSEQECKCSPPKKRRPMQVVQKVCKPVVYQKRQNDAVCAQSRSQKNK